MAIEIPGGTAGTDIISSALDIAGKGSDAISTVLQDIQSDSILGGIDAVNRDLSSAGQVVLQAYGYSDTAQADIRQASGAMVIDDLMQKISTKVQVASQMLATLNNINKTASRVISQG